MSTRSAEWARALEPFKHGRSTNAADDRGKQSRVDDVERSVVGVLGVNDNQNLGHR
jgi:hypothetical protein